MTGAPFDVERLPGKAHGLPAARVVALADRLDGRPRTTTARRYGVRPTLTELDATAFGYTLPTPPRRRHR